MAEQGILPASARDPVWRRIDQWGRRHAMGVYALQLSVLALLIVAVPFSLIEIPAGHVGVLWQRFFGGTVTDDSYGEGLRVIFPWDHITLYDARLQNSARYYDTISSNGLGMEVDIAVRFRINREAVGALHKLVGPRYDEVLVYPEIGSHARDYISRYLPEQLYSANRAFIQAEILKRMRADGGASLLAGQGVAGKLVEVEDVLIRGVRLPARVEDAIERKVEQQQAVLEYDFRIARETKEAERKRIEAEGVRVIFDETGTPRGVADAVARGHEISCHGYRWETHAGMEESRERAVIARTVESIAAAAGRPPVGWHTRSAASVNTRRLLCEHGGFLYDSDAYNDDLPYVLTVAGAPHVVLPYSFDTNDMRFGPGGGFVFAEDFARYCADAFDRLWEEGAKAPKMMSVGLHLRFIGRPGRIRGLEMFLDHIARKGRAWIARRDEIAHHWRSVAGLGPWAPAAARQPQAVAD